MKAKLLLCGLVLSFVVGLTSCLVAPPPHPGYGGHRHYRHRHHPPRPPMPPRPPHHPHGWRYR